MYSLKLYNDSKHIRDVAHWYWYCKDGKFTAWIRVFGRGLYLTNNWERHWKFKILRKEVGNG